MLFILACVVCTYSIHMDIRPDDSPFGAGGSWPQAASSAQAEGFIGLLGLQIHPDMWNKSGLRLGQLSI